MRKRFLPFSCFGLMLVAAALVFFVEASRSIAVTTPPGRPQTYLSRIHAMAFSPDGQLLAASGWRSTVELWDSDGLIEQPDAPAFVLPQSGMTFALAFSPTEPTLAVGGYAADSLWSIDRDSARQVASHAGESCRSLAFSADGQTLAMGHVDGSIEVRDAATMRQRFTLDVHKDVVVSLAFSPDGKKLVSTSQRKDGLALVWDMATAKAERNLAATLPRATRLAAYSADGRTVALGEVGSCDRLATLFDVTTGQVIGQLPGPGHAVSAIAFSPGGHTLATADDVITLWDVRTLTPRVTLEERIGPGNSIAFSPDGSRLAFAAQNGKPRIRVLNDDPIGAVTLKAN